MLASSKTTKRMVKEYTIAKMEQNILVSLSLAKGMDLELPHCKSTCLLIIYNRPSGVKLVGQFKDDKVNGYCTIFLPNGEKKLTQFENDLPIKFMDIL